jgi:hypothetical protein
MKVEILLKGKLDDVQYGQANLSDCQWVTTQALSNFKVAIEY